MWNNTDTPLAYLISFRTYGTWLHGDERGSIDRHRNSYGSPYIRPNADWHSENAARLKFPPVRLNAKRRKTAEDAVREVCEKCGWSLFAVNARTNHVHSVVANGGVDPGIVLGKFKSRATRRMRENGSWTSVGSPWSDKGSKVRLWNERSIAQAVDYVLNQRGGRLPEFD